MQIEMIKIELYNTICRVVYDWKGYSKSRQ